MVVLGGVFVCEKICLYYGSLKEGYCCFIVGKMLKGNLIEVDEKMVGKDMEISNNYDVMGIYCVFICWCMFFVMISEVCVCCF